jgi:hypothetical protein
MTLYTPNSGQTGSCTCFKVGDRPAVYEMTRHYGQATRAPPQLMCGWLGRRCSGTEPGSSPPKSASCTAPPRARHAPSSLPPSSQYISPLPAASIRTHSTTVPDYARTSRCGSERATSDQCSLTAAGRNSQSSTDGTDRFHRKIGVSDSAPPAGRPAGRAAGRPEKKVSRARHGPFHYKIVGISESAPPAGRMGRAAGRPERKFPLHCKIGVLDSAPPARASRCAGASGRAAAAAAAAARRRRRASRTWRGRWRRWGCRASTRRSAT